MEIKSNLSDYTKQEFIALIGAINNAGTEEDRGELVEHFNKIVPHPSGSDLLFYPEEGADDSPKGVVQIINDYCISKNLPGFRD
ncbi:bacteriocin immunity protein [Pseudomonas sp. MPC6]|uniref:bacteriocin immunity protein n=1 Tax=unclassified Pseudomonas TaxID=196821 RepID=UPI0011105C35|nr:bacteriocin immunity protein [Pseudomonas sp. MPC6]QCY14671.1 bacteriocin immunity protein [Pseudomonas sp. MPC6]